MKQRGVFLIGLILVGIYFFLFPRSSRGEYVLYPEKQTAFMPARDTPDRGAETEIALRSGDLAAYVDGSLDVIRLLSAERMAADDDWSAVSGPEGLELSAADGRILSRSADTGYPIARNGNLFLYDGVGRVEKIGPSSGLVLWSREYLSPVTVLDAVGERTLVGLLDGRVEIVEDDGTVIFEYRPGGSGIEAIYGGALSSDAAMIALIAGLYPQRFILLQERKNGFRPVAHHDAGTDYRRAVRVGFVRDDGEVLYESGDSVAAVNTADFRVETLVMDGRVVDWWDGPAGNDLVMMGRGSDGASLKILTKENLTMYDGAVPDDTVGIRQVGERTFIVRPDGFGVLKAEIR